MDNILNKNSRLLDFLEITVITMDRVLLSFENDKRDELLGDLNKLEKYFGDSTKFENQDIIDLFLFVGKWFRYLQLNFKNQSEVLDVFEYYTFLTSKSLEDENIKLLLNSAKETFENIDKSRYERLYLKSKYGFITEALFSLMFSIYVELDFFKSKTIGNIFNDQFSSDVKNLIESINNEYILLANNSKGRDKDLVNLKASVLENKVTLLQGKRNVGKSTILAKLIINNTQKSDKQLLLIFSFKHSTSIVDFIRSIVEQINSHIVNRIDVSFFNEYVGEVAEQSERNINLYFNQSNIQKINYYFKEATRRLNQECGNFILIIDSFEMISQMRKEIADLLIGLPENSKLILVTNNSDDVSLFQTEGTQILSTNNFEESDMKYFSGLKEANEYNNKINSELFEKTNGEVAKLKKLLSLVEEGEGLVTTELINSLDNSEVSRFEQELQSYNQDETFEEILLLLAVFEPVQSIPLEYIQQFLHFREIHCRLPKVRNELKKIKVRINDTRFTRVKLIDKDFALFLKEKYFSSKDIKESIRYTLEWLSADASLKSDFIAESLKGIEKENLWLSRKTDINLFVESMSQNAGGRKIFKIGYSFFHDPGIAIDLTMEFLEKAYKLGVPNSYSFLGYIYMKGKRVDTNVGKAELILRDGVKNGDSISKGILGSLLLDGMFPNEDNIEGLQLLKESAAEGNKTAKLDLAVRLLIGKGVESDITVSDSILEELIENEDNVDAFRIMGIRNLYGHYIKRNVEKGMNLLNIAIDRGDELAKYQMAKYILNVSRDNQTMAIKYFDELTESGFIEAKKYYSYLLISGTLIHQNIEKGLSLLKELIDIADEEAILDYSQLLFEGKYIEKDIILAQELLGELVGKEYPEGLVYYGELLIEGLFYERNIEKGIKQLEKAASIGEISAIRNLANKYWNGHGVEKNQYKSRELFLKAIKAGDLNARYHYAKCIINENKIKEDELEYAINLLEYAETNGSILARNYLADLFIDEELVKGRVEEGLNHLRKSIELSDPKAMRKLGYRMLYGNGLPKNIFEGEQLLLNSINLGDTLAKTILGQAIIIGISNVLNFTAGIKLMEEACSEGEVNALRILGDAYVRGAYVKQNKEKGENLLRLAIKSGDNLAALILSRILLDGLFLEKNQSEGIEILTKLENENYEDGILELSERLIKGDSIKKNIDFGLEKLRKLSEYNVEAKVMYGFYLTTGNEGVCTNIKKGEGLLREAELQGNDYARRLLAEFLINGLFNQRYEGEGISLLEKSVENNDYLAMATLGDIYLDGVSTKMDTNKAIELFEKTVDGRSAEAKVRYACYLADGTRIPQDIKKAVNLFTDSSNSGDLAGKYYLAKLYIESENSYKNVPKGITLLEELIANGYYKAKEYLALLKIYGFNMDKDIEQGIRYFEELVDSDKDKAILQYSELLIEGIYLKKDVKKGEKLLKYLIRKGNGEANYRLAIAYIEGKSLKKHVNSGNHRLRKAMELQSKGATLEYGIRLKKGLKIGKDEAKGKRNINNALENASPQDLYQFGIIAYGLKDYELATDLLMKSRDAGFQQAGTSIAYMLRRKELKSHENVGSIFTLLENELYNNDITAYLNLVLAIVREQTLDSEWLKADSIIQKLGNCSLYLGWWLDIALSDDPEGHLILGWLSKHHKIDDPSGYTFKTRFAKARCHDYKIPDWMFEEEYKMEYQSKEIVFF